MLKWCTIIRWADATRLRLLGLSLTGTRLRVAPGGCRLRCDLQAQVTARLSRDRAEERWRGADRTRKQSGCM
ncbi:hypothetical protein NDU88_009879 [Pleurodeles waltl]|uniref:Uncharacterized protein n=1 Tax=Pleurodeles waltl TaxID=8319 RepID=A0AAV7RXV7_PLEWA|nr:hypothetical protein NDU88_009879 [Pleurodeles waltl]